MSSSLFFSSILFLGRLQFCTHQQLPSHASMSVFQAGGRQTERGDFFAGARSGQQTGTQFVRNLGVCSEVAPLTKMQTRARDVVPLRVGDVLLDYLKKGGGLSTSQRRRARRRAVGDRWMAQGVASLNALGSSGTAHTGGISAAQRSSLDGMHRHYAHAATQIHGIEPQRAYSELLKSKGRYSQSSSSGAPCAVAVYRAGTVKYPAIEGRGIPLSEVAPPELAQQIRDGSGIIKPSGGDFTPPASGSSHAFDSVLRRRGWSYGHFLGELIEYDLAEPVGEPGTHLAPCVVFFVQRKDAMVRLIVDPGPANDICEVPPHTRLPSVANLGTMEVPPGKRAYFRSGDVDCCFFQYELPEWARALFVMPSIHPRFLPKRVRKFSGLKHGNNPAYFRFKVVPMGWSWSVYLVTHIQLAILQSSVPMPWMRRNRSRPDTQWTECACFSSTTSLC